MLERYKIRYNVWRSFLTFGSLRDELLKTQVVGLTHLDCLFQFVTGLCDGFIHSSSIGELRRHRFGGDYHRILHDPP